MAPRKTSSKGKTTISSPGKTPVTFQKGGLHQSTGTPPGQPIPAAKMAAAASGKLGPKAQKQANLAKMLAAGRKTAARNRKSK
jgi:hypothetical protein